MVKQDNVWPFDKNLDDDYYEEDYEEEYYTEDGIFFRENYFLLKKKLFSNVPL